MSTVSRIYDLRGSQTVLTVHERKDDIIEIRGRLYPAPNIGDFIIDRSGVRYAVTSTGTEGKGFWAFVEPRGLV